MFDVALFRQWYENYYLPSLGKKRDLKTSKVNVLAKKRSKICSRSTPRWIPPWRSSSTRVVFVSRPGQSGPVNGYLLEAVAWCIPAVRPTKIYNLAAQSHAMVSFDLSEYTAEVDAAGTLRLLDVIRTCGLEYGKVLEMPQTKKKTPFNRDSSWRVENFFLGQLICLELGNLVTGATPGRLSVGLSTASLATGRG
ncbi:hypothetical protein quinque_014822 [Culex quinquefasciatus]